MEPTPIFDRLPLSGLQRDSAGNVVGVARAARTGIQVYAGYEVGRPDLAQVRIWRPESEVFSRDSMSSFAGVPVTIDHPSDFVTVDNWKDHAAGETASDDIVRDGESVKVPFILRDAAAIQAIEDGKHEVSMGYSSMLDWKGGTVPDGQADAGQAYDAVQRGIRINHLAIVDKARGGETLRIGDNSRGNPPKEKNVKTMMVDGLSVEVGDAAETAIKKLLDERNAARDSLTEAQEQVGTLTAEKTALEADKAKLEKDLEDAASPDKLHAAATARASLLSDAKRLCPTGKFDDASDDDIRRAVVEHKLGDAGKALDDAAIPGAFAALVAQTPADDATKTNDSAAPKGSDRLAALIADSGNGNGGDKTVNLADARNAALARRNARYGNYGRDPAKSA